jgi:hypothetical protein
MVQGRLAEPGPGNDFKDSPYDYSMAKAAFGRLFTGLRLRPRPEEFARVKTQYAAITGESREFETGHSAKPASGRPELLDFALSIPPNKLTAKTPFHRTEYYLAKSLRWRSILVQKGHDPLQLGLFLAENRAHAYEPGRTYRQRWGQGVFGTSFNAAPLFGPRFSVMRQGDTFTAGPNLFVDSDPNHVDHPKFLGGQARLFRDGQPIRDWSNSATFSTDLPPEQATYRLEIAVTPPDSEISTSVTSSWTFRSKRVDGPQAAALPLLSVRYSPDLDERNHARPGKHYMVPLELSRQPGAGSAVIERPAVQISYDDGKTWHRSRVTPRGANRARWSAEADNPDGGAVSLRILAKDTDGNEIQQTIIRAYLVNG